MSLMSGHFSIKWRLPLWIELFADGFWSYMQVKKMISFSASLLSLTSFVASVPARALELPYTPLSHQSKPLEYRENGVPFVTLDPTDVIQEPLRSEIVQKNDESGEDSQFVQLTDEDTVVSHEEIIGEKNLTASRAWKSTDFSKQNQAMGWTPEAFAVPKGLEVNVSFWKDIYTKYNSDQGVLHDADNIDLVYEELDFTSISSRSDLNSFQKESAKKRMVKDAKNRVISLLQELNKTSDPSNLNPAKKKIWDYFQRINEKNKFVVASKKNRLRFQLGQRDRMIQGIFFSGRYIEEFEKIFAEAGLPLELVRLPFVESSFNVLARSKVGASGLWQIMPYTTKGYWRRDSSIDLRNHPVEATRLASKLMRVNFNLLQSWPLALTGYNHGPNGVLKLTKKFESRDISELVRQKAFGFASRNFYASFLAALEVTNNAPKYFGNIAWSETLGSIDIKAHRPILYSELLKWFDNDDLKAQVFNPHITKVGRKGKAIPAGFVFSVPQSKSEIVKKDLKAHSVENTAKFKDTEARQPSAEVATKYTVRRGDSIRKIAEQFGVKERDLIGHNNLSKENKLRAGKVIEIP